MSTGNSVRCSDALDGVCNLEKQHFDSCFELKTRCEIRLIMVPTFVCVESRVHICLKVTNKIEALHFLHHF